MTPSSSYFFRVEHDLLRSDAFKTLGGSAIKVYLVIGLYSDFGTDWAYPSIRTIARHAGLSRQTVLTAIDQLTQMGLLATSKARGRSTAYRIIRQAPQRERRSPTKDKDASGLAKQRGLISLEETAAPGLKSLENQPSTRPKFGQPEAQSIGVVGPSIGPEEHPRRPNTASVPIPGSPFRLAADGRVLITVDLHELLRDQGIPDQLAQRLLAQKDPEAVAKVLLNAFYLQSKGKLQNGPGYIRAGIEDGYDLLPQVASHLETRRRQLEIELQSLEARKQQAQLASACAAEQAAIDYVLERLAPEQLSQLLDRARRLLPEPIVRRNPTVSNPFIRTKVYELAIDEAEN